VGGQKQPHTNVEDEEVRSRHKVSPGVLKCSTKYSILLTHSLAVVNH
jgi:hypothetical protein